MLFRSQLSFYSIFDLIIDPSLLHLLWKHTLDYIHNQVLPQLTSGIVYGFMMSITLTLDDYFITTYTKPSMFDTISTYFVNATKGAQTDVKTALWALSTIIFLIVIFVVIGMNHTGRKENDHEI